MYTLAQYTGWSRGNTCFSYKNNFVYFQHKKVSITQKRRYFNAFLKYVPNYIRKIMSVKWPSCRTHIRSHSSKSCITRSNIFCGTVAISWWMERSGRSKCFNPSEYSVLIWNCTSTINNELSTEKTLDSNYGITVSKKLLDGKHTMLYVPMHHGYWNCNVWAVRRLTPNVINPTLTEY